LFGLLFNNLRASRKFLDFTDSTMAQPQSKSEEARASREADMEEEAPAYSDHYNDEIYIDPADESELPEAYSAIPRTYAAQESQGASPLGPPVSEKCPLPYSRSSSPTPHNNEVPATGPITLHLDKDLIFPGPPPCNAIYSLDYVLQSRGDKIMLRRSIPGTMRADGTARMAQDKDLYEIQRNFDLGTFSLVGQRRSTHRGDIVLKLKTSLLGKKSWDCVLKSTGREDILLKSNGAEWQTHSGTVIARERDDIVVPKRELKGKGKEKADEERGAGVKDELILLERRDQMLVDLLVSVWVAKLWFGESYEYKTRNPTKDESNF